MDEGLYVGRNDALVFAQRTRKNLEIIEMAVKMDPNIHVVTQLVNSLLGLLVFLRERQFLKHVGQQTLDKLVSRGWPRVECTKGECPTLGDFIYHLRNAVAHGRVKFSSDSRDLGEVTIDFEDWKPGASEAYWSACMKANDLRDFCLNLIGLLEDTIG